MSVDYSQGRDKPGVCVCSARGLGQPGNAAENAFQLHQLRLTSNPSVYAR